MFSVWLMQLPFSWTDSNTKQHRAAAPVRFVWRSEVPSTMLQHRFADTTRILLQAKPSVPWPSGLTSVLHLRSVCSYKKVLSHIPLHFLLASYRTALLSHGGRGVAALAWSVPNPSPLCDPFYDQSRHWRIPALKACPAHSGFPGTKKTSDTEMTSDYNTDSEQVFSSLLFPILSHLSVYVGFGNAMKSVFNLSI